MIGKMKSSMKSENGAVQIVEASFVFPIMFIVLIFLIFMGNAHFVKSKMEAIVTEYAIKGAAYCADPVQKTMEESGSYPSLSDIDIEPYRYLFGGMDDIEKHINAAVYKEIKDNSSSFFQSMAPKLKTGKADISRFNNYVVYSTFSVEVKYNLSLPITFFGKDIGVLKMSARSEVPVNDTAEFIRNTDMVIDVFHGTKLGQSISSVFEKIQGVLNSFAEK